MVYASKLTIMKTNLLPVFAVLFICQHHLTQSKNIDKRYSPCYGGNCGLEPIGRCPGGRCGGGGGCGGGGCLIRPPCSGGGCGGGCNGGNCPIIDPPAPRPCNGGGCDIPNPPCSSCVRGCSNRCSNNQCLNSCLSDCSCDNERIIEPEKCCDVLHPKQCYTEEDGNKRCVVRRHRECSNLCSSSVVSIQEGGSNTGCQYVKNYPYAYCGNYERHNCGQCFTCDGSTNPGTCSQRSECTDSCRNVIRG